MKSLFALVYYFVFISFSLLGQSFISHATIDGDFCDSTVIVIMDKYMGGVNKKHDISYFKDIDIVEIYDLFTISDESLSRTNLETFRQILRLRLLKKDKQNVLDVIEALRYIEGVEYADPNYRLYPCSVIPNDPSFHEQWGLTKIQAPEAWQYTTGSFHVMVGVIDSGIGYHYDLGTNMIAGYNFVTNVPIFPTSGNFVQHEHGTRVAGIIGAIGNNNLGVAGVNWHISLVSLQVEGGEATPAPYYQYETLFSAGIDLAIRAIAYSHDLEVPIINYSFAGFGDYLPLKYAVENYFGFFVAAAGNATSLEHTHNVDDYPFAKSFLLPNLISVGATDINDNFASISKWGRETIMIYAPGDNILSTIMVDDFQNYSPDSGTSFAAPFVSGVAALLLALDPTLSAELLKSIILHNADQIVITTPAGVQNALRLNAYNAVANAHIPFEVIETDMYITSDQILDKRYIIIDGATLTIDGATLSAYYPQSNFTSYLGFDVRDGTLIITNASDIDLGNGYIRAFGENSSVIASNSNITMQGGSINLKNKVSFSLSNSSYLTVTDDTEIYLTDSSLSITNSHFYISDGLINLSSRSSIDFSSQSSFVSDGSTDIVGHTLRYFTPLLPDPNDSNPPTWDGQMVMIPGDRIAFFDSYVNIGSETEIYSGSGTRWDGLSLFHCSPDSLSSRNTISADISGIHELRIGNSAVDILNSTITNIGQLHISGDSDVNVVNTNYHDNDYGIISFGSSLSVVNSLIANNAHTGVYISNNPNVSFIRNSIIVGNEGMGVDIRNNIVSIEHSHIENNSGSGFHSLSLNQSFIRGNSQIIYNQGSQVVARGDAFPHFDSLGIISVFPTVIDGGGTSYPLPTYLLHALGRFVAPIYIGNLVIDTSDQSRFFPTLSSFSFGNVSNSPEVDLYYEAIKLLHIKDYQGAFDNVLSILCRFHNTDVAKRAYTLLPYLCYYTDTNFYDTLDLISSAIIGLPPLLQKQIQGLNYIFSKEYIAAIEVYDQILSDPPHPLDELLAELDQAYCYFMLVTNGQKNLPAKSRRKPMTFSEYRSIEKEIYDKISQLLLSEKEDQEDIIETAYRYSLSNYPNPFNPETTIHFSIPVDTNVTIDIFNVKGQKVKSLVNDMYQTGNHIAVWSGHDNNGRAVSSGIYFYRMQTDGYTATKKMLLLK